MYQEPNEVHDIIDAAAAAQAQITHTNLIMFALIGLLCIITILLANWIGRNDCDGAAQLNHALSWSYNLFKGCYLDGVPHNSMSVMDIFR